MEITVEQAQGRVPVTILGLHGDLDASSYQDLIAKVKALYGAGTRHLLIDMGGAPFMGSSGLVALHSAALVMGGAPPPDPEAGWRAFRAVGEIEPGSAQKHIKLLNPQAQVDRVLERTGLKQFFDIHTDRQAAIDSF